MGESQAVGPEHSEVHRTSYRKVGGPQEREGKEETEMFSSEGRWRECLRGHNAQESIGPDLG